MFLFAYQHNEVVTVPEVYFYDLPLRNAARFFFLVDLSSFSSTLTDFFS